MAEPEPNASQRPTQAEERGAGLALLPVAATLNFYLLPEPLQSETLIQFIPQILGYLTLALWAQHNTALTLRLGLLKVGGRAGLRIGLITGLLLGSFNTVVILKIVPWLGEDITFLRTTPHAQIPVFVMIPWFICAIAVFVELNFRGFLLGRLLTLGLTIFGTRLTPWVSGGAIGISAIVFAFDPFMVNTFHHLHWIAVWDGMIWGILWVRTRNLYLTIIAHAVEVIIMYSVIRTVLSG
jgi:membrane protease YdiL (CAAX protease family)